MPALDTLGIAKRLKEAGLPEPAAEAVAGVIHDTQQLDRGRFPTKDDLTREIGLLRTELRAEIAELRTELRAEIAELRTELRAEIAELRTELRTAITGIRNEMALLESGIEARMTAMELRILRWVFGMIVAQAALVLTVLRMFPNH
ncbi:MAG: DUF1640 domain-containing protein [Alphaproteobacteria bacterium]|nr:DUF1640 domain-containing protein [Alphaproteobacteria bacterium]